MIATIPIAVPKKTKKPGKCRPKEERLVIDPDKAEAALNKLLSTKKR